MKGISTQFVLLNVASHQEEKLLPKHIIVKSKAMQETVKCVCVCVCAVKQRNSF